MTTQNNTPKLLRTVEGISEYEFENGLKLLLMPDATQSKVTINFTYLVGARHEGRGEKGMAHLLEHMLFKDSKNFKDIPGQLQRRGAFSNASTWLDRTNYYETLPASSDNLKFALELEADRMLHSSITQEDLAAEMTVVRNEFEMGENSPQRVLMERMISTSYLWHNYANSTIGNRSDIERVPASKLKVFYKKYYQPHNVVAIIAGQFDSEEALALAQNTLGNIPKSDIEIEETYTQEPPQDGARLVRLERNGDAAYTGLAYHIPAASHEDFAPIALFSSMLTDEPGGFLYEKMVQTHKVTELWSHPFSLFEPGIMLVFARPSDNDKVDAVKEMLIDLMETQGLAGVTEDRLKRAKAEFLKHYKLTLANSQQLAIGLSESIAQGDFALFFYDKLRVEKTTLADIKRVAEKYFTSSNRTAGVFVPTKSPNRVEVSEAISAKELVKGFKGTGDLVEGEAFEASVPNIEKRTKRSTLKGGIKAALLHKQTRNNSVKAKLIFRMGNEKVLKNQRAALDLLPDIMMRGTKTKSYQELRDTLDALQSSLKLSYHHGAATADINSDSDSLPAVLNLLAEIMKTPSFDAKEFEILKKQELDDYKEHLSDPNTLGSIALKRKLSPFPKESFHYVPTLEESIAELKQVSLSRLQELHSVLYGAEHLELSVVGAFDEKGLVSTIETNFGDFKSPTSYERVKSEHIATITGKEVIKTPDKKSAIVLFGKGFALNDEHPDYPALVLANYGLGGHWTSMLFDQVREKAGLSYSVGSSLQAGTFEARAKFSMYAYTAPENLQKATDTMKRVFSDWVKNGLSKEMLEENKQSYQNRFNNLLAQDGVLTNVLASDLEKGRTLEFLDKRMKKIMSVSQSELTATIQKYFNDQDLALVQAGDIK